MILLNNEYHKTLKCSPVVCTSVHVMNICRNKTTTDLSNYSNYTIFLSGVLSRREISVKDNNYINLSGI